MAKGQRHEARYHLVKMLRMSEMISPSNDKYSPRFMEAKNRKYTTRFPKEKTTTTNQRRSSRTFFSNTHNLQERRESEGEINHIPTINNGITNTTHNSHSNLASPTSRNHSSCIVGAVVQCGGLFSGAARQQRISATL